MQGKARCYVFTKEAPCSQLWKVTNHGTIHATCPVSIVLITFLCSFQLRSSMIRTFDDGSGPAITNRQRGWSHSYVRRYIVMRSCLLKLSNTIPFRYHADAVRREFALSRSFALITNFFSLQEGWNQIQFNLSDFTRRAYGTNYVETLRVQIHANCRIRRVYFSDRLYSEDELPAEFKLFLPIQKPQQSKAVASQ